MRQEFKIPEYGGPMMGRKDALASSNQGGRPHTPLTPKGTPKYAHWYINNNKRATRKDTSW